MPNPSVMKHVFSEVPRAEIPRSTFERSHGYKTTFDAGYLIPIYCDEALPGDTATVRMTGFARLATPIVPLMDNMRMETFFFSVPVRLLWDNWQKFNGEQLNPGDSTDYLVPQLFAPGAGFAAGSLEDYFGIPTGVGNLAVCSLWHRAYNRIWSEWFRDQNLQNTVPLNTTDGPDTSTDYTLLRRGKRHDYFTSCLPWPQKGPGVSIPLGVAAPVRGIGTLSQVFSSANTTVWESGSPVASTVYPNARIIGTTGPDAYVAIKGTAAGGGEPDIYADLSQASAATINSLRQAFQIQKVYERDARGGTRYTELIKAHFGVTSPDARLQRPEFLGGGSSPVIISPIPQTSGTAGTGAYTPTPQGNLAAMGTATLRNHGFTASFTEHCIVMGLLSVRADLTYQQGLNRMFSRRSRFDFYWPALAHIGEQAVLNKEIYAVGDLVPGQDDAVFGYQERYAEYRYKPSLITGQFRSTHATPLDVWHLSQEFTALPTLSAAFIQENPPVDRVIAVPSEPHFLFDSYFDMRWARPMPVYGVPGMIDHF